MNKIKIGLSMGDPNGVGLEIILAVFEDTALYKHITPILFAPKNTVDFQKKYLKKQTKLNFVNEIINIKKGFLNVFEIPDHNFKTNFGIQCKKAGSLSVDSLSKSVEAIKNKEVDVLVTAPINKKSIQSDKFKFPGHTDYLNKNFEGQKLMFMISDKLKIALVTDHIPINKISSMVSKDIIISKINQVQTSLINDFGIVEPKLAILGMNPHCGDDGVIGNEDDTIIKPCICEIRKNKINVDGPFAADSFFGAKKHIKYDAIIAIYHDQGLIPFKTLSFGKGVNFTAGLNLIRTSPDHGTAFDIAGKGIACASSYKSAILESVKIYKNRN
jgi:4-hydroxythreonine-4-phosphate dehydrogenase